MFVGLICSDILLFLVCVLVPFVRGYESKFNECVEWRRVTGVGWGWGSSELRGGREGGGDKEKVQVLGHTPPPPPPPHTLNRSCVP